MAPALRHELLSLAHDSIESSLQSRELTPCPLDRVHVDLMRAGSSFVTLRIGCELRGCCGSIEPTRALAQDVWCNAWASAFTDPRFPQLSRDEWARTQLQLSLLSAPEPWPVVSEAELIEQLRPFVDGLILQHGAARATFLPAVWEQIPEPARFVRQLKLKAGWPADFWPSTMRVLRYTTESFGEAT